MKAEIHKGKEAKIIKFINAAKSSRLITKSSAKKAEKVVNFRNKFHPVTQTSLHTKIDPEVFILSNEVVPDLAQDLRRYFVNLQREIVISEQLKKDYLRRRREFIRELLEEDE